MSEIETLLREARASKVTGVTLWPIGDQWQANVKRGSGWIVTYHADPVPALIEALTTGMGTAPAKKVVAPVALTETKPENSAPVAASVFD